MQIPAPIRRMVLVSLPVLFRPVWWWVRLQGWWLQRLWQHRKTRKVLLICHNPVAADHLRPIVTLLQEKPEIRLFVANDHFPAQEIDSAEIRAKVPVPYLPILWCLLCHWDLVVYVNHAWGFGAWLAPCVKKIYINHGLYVGKINNAIGEDGVYGRHRTHRPHRGRLYDCMLAASHAEREAALRANPDLNGVVHVAGSLMADAILARKDDQQRIRKELRLHGDRPVIHVISTWGTASLAATTGDQLLVALTDAGLIDNTLFSLHPRYDKFGGTAEYRTDILARWAQAGARVDKENVRWQDFVLAADTAIADHSSLASYHLLLEHSIIFVAVRSEQHVAGSPFSEAAHLFPTWTSGKSLVDMLHHPRHLPNAERNRLNARLLTRPGEAAALHLREINSLVGTEAITE